MCLISLQAGIIQQPAGRTYVAFEATTVTVVKGTPESWTSATVAEATAGTALYTSGTNSTGDSPHSFAQYQIQFRTAGTYYLYYRWKADEARTGGDNATANSCWLATTWGAYRTPADQAPFYRSDSNNASAPADNTFAWRMEPTATYTVDTAELAEPVIFTVGTREAGMTFDRFVFSTEAGLTASQLDILTYELSNVTQGVGDTYTAFQAEGPVMVIAGTPESWAFSNIVNAVSGAALYSSGTNSTGDSPHSFAWYEMHFKTAGAYYLYYRWKADEARTGGDNATANSSWLPNALGANSTPGDQSAVFRSDSNNASAPADNTFAWRMEPTMTYTVDTAELAGPVTFTVGTREAGMIFDRFVFSTQTGLTDAQLDALVDSGTEAPAPEITGAVGWEGLNGVTVTFSRPLAPASTQASDFSFTPNLGVTSVELDADDARIVRLTTAAQPPGTQYILGVTGVTDVSGTPIKAGASRTFTSWKPVNGWAKEEMYLEITGATVADLAGAAKYPAKPDKVQFVRGFRLPRSGEFLNMGVRLSAWFHPSSNDAFDLFVNNDDEAEVFLSSDAGEAGLNSLGVLPLHAAPFADGTSVATPALSSGQKYLLRGVLKQGGGDYYLEVGARPVGATTPTPDVLTALSGDQISTMVNPDLGVVTFDSQPADTTVAAGSRARFVAKVTTLSSPVYFQWQLNGVDIPGATRHTYVTPVLTTADTGKHYTLVVSVAGTTTTSRQASLTVTPGGPSNLQPYVGVNFIGAGYVSDDAVSLSPVDVAGVVNQDNWNNVGLGTDPVSLKDARGTDSPIQLTLSTSSGTGLQLWNSGTRRLGEADGDLMQGYLNNGFNGTNGDPVILTLTGVPVTNYQLIVYTTGFDFQANYEESFSVTGGGSYPTYHGKAEIGSDYVANPAYRRITSTTPATRQSGNYVQYDSVSPASDGTLTLSVLWEAAIGSSTYNPVINGFQLVKVTGTPQTTSPTLTAVAHPGTLTLGWGADAVGFTLQSSPTVGPAAVWNSVPSVPGPLTGAGSADIATTNASAQYYRLVK